MKEDGNKGGHHQAGRTIANRHKSGTGNLPELRVCGTAVTTKKITMKARLDTAEALARRLVIFTTDLSRIDSGLTGLERVIIHGRSSSYSM